MWLCTKSQIACTRGQPSGVLEKRFHAKSLNRSVSQYRLPNRNTRVSSGRCSTLCCQELGSACSSNPESRTVASAVNVRVPCGATSREHQFPKPSRYEVTGTEGMVMRLSGRTRSDARL